MVEVALPLEGHHPDSMAAPPLRGFTGPRIAAMMGGVVQVGTEAVYPAVNGSELQANMGFVSRTAGEACCSTGMDVGVLSGVIVVGLERCSGGTSCGVDLAGVQWETHERCSMICSNGRMWCERARVRPWTSPIPVDVKLDPLARALSVQCLAWERGRVRSCSDLPGCGRGLLHPLARKYRKSIRNWTCKGGPCSGMGRLPVQRGKEQGLLGNGFLGCTIATPRHSIYAGAHSIGIGSVMERFRAMDDDDGQQHHKHLLACFVPFRNKGVCRG